MSLLLLQQTAENLLEARQAGRVYVAAITRRLLGTDAKLPAGDDGRELREYAHGGQRMLEGERMVAHSSVEEFR
jgi:hypothetical protein